MSVLINFEKTICSSDIAHLSFFSSLLIFNANSKQNNNNNLKRRSLNRNGVIRNKDLDGRVVGLRGSAGEDDLSGICSDQISHLLLRAKGNSQRLITLQTGKKNHLSASITQIKSPYLSCGLHCCLTLPAIGVCSGVRVTIVIHLVGQHGVQDTRILLMSAQIKQKD